MHGTRELVRNAVIRSRSGVSINGWWRNVGIVVGREAPNRESATQYRELMEYLIGQNPKGAALLTVVRPQSTPNPEAREIILGMFRDLWPDLLAAVFVVEGKGFGAATQRGIMSALMLAMGRSAKVKIFSDVELAVGWLASELARVHPRLGEDGLRRDLMDATFEVLRVADTSLPPPSTLPPGT